MSINEQMEERIAFLERALSDERRVREARAARVRAWIKRAKAATIGAIALGAAFGFLRVALAGTCAATVPAPLLTFCAGNPAVAADINFNFTSLANTLIAKVGALSSTDATMNNVTMKSATVTGNATVSGSATVTGSATVNGNATVKGQLLVGYGVQSCQNNSICSCPANEVVLGGGGSCNGSAIVYSGPAPFNSAAWSIGCPNSALPTNVWVYCARLGL